MSGQGVGRTGTKTSRRGKGEGWDGRKVARREVGKKGRREGGREGEEIR